MAATAYASLVSLLNTLDQVHTHPLVSTFFDINQHKSLSEKVNFFIDFVEKYSDAESGEVEDLMRRIADAARVAENKIELHAAYQIRGDDNPYFLAPMPMTMKKMEFIQKQVIKVIEETAKSPSCLLNLPSSVADRIRGRRCPSFLLIVQMILKKMESIKEVIKKTGNIPSFLPNLPPSVTSMLSASLLLSSSSSAPRATAEATTMVGFKDYMEKLFNDLTGHDDARQIISITGMGGIGKTTLARNLYENPKIMRHFNVRVWVTVSQESSARKVFLQALSCLGGGSIDMDTADDGQLSLELHKTLFNRRYLIVLDDVWSVDIWDKIKLYFPENNNRSRIVVTTRESRLVDYIGSSAIAVMLLDEENSWKLFCEKTFPRQDFPPALEEVGKKIVKKCGGLPLAITVIGGLLAKSPRTQEDWEKIAKDKSLILNIGENKPSSILYLSYKYLPVYLRPCFLYLGLYPEDYDIDGSILIKLWVAKGFIKANKGQSLEEVAESYLNNLIDRNLLLRSPISTPSSKTYYTHDLVRELCIQIGKKESLFGVQWSIYGNHEFIDNQPTTRIYAPPSRFHIVTEPIRLLRVFCSDDENIFRYVLREVNMIFLQLHPCEHIYLRHSFLSQCWRLQTLIVSRFNWRFSPSEIWKMPQLRHIDIQKLRLPNPPPQSDGAICILQNLQTLKTVENLILTEEVCKRIPNIKELCINYDFRSQSKGFPFYHLDNLPCFNKLELLQYECYQPERAVDSLRNIKFPSSLKELTLTNCELEWNYMALIASLPHLQSLSLAKNALAEKEWNFVDEEFVSLKRLNISSCYNLRKWIAESSNFPVLEKLSIVYCLKLDEIPLGIGEIPTLQEIVLWGCTKSANISALEILHEQEIFGNLGLRLIIKSEEPEELMEKIQELDLTCQNLEIVSFNDP